jgi:hypothetical protein
MLIPDPYFAHPGSRIPDPTRTKTGRENNDSCYLFGTIKLTKLKIIFFEKVQKI